MFILIIEIGTLHYPNPPQSRWLVIEMYYVSKAHSDKYHSLLNYADTV